MLNERRQILFLQLDAIRLCPVGRRDARRVMAPLLNCTWPDLSVEPRDRPWTVERCVNGNEAPTTDLSDLIFSPLSP